MNDLYARGTGLAASARRAIALLRERGYDVRVLAAPPLDGDDCGIGAPDYPLPHLRVPLLAPLIASQGYAFARSDRRQIDRALDWADVVHLEEPFMLQAVVARRARDRGVPAMATYHIHPENLTVSVYLDRCTRLKTRGLIVGARLVERRLCDIGVWVPSMTSVYASVSWSVFMAGWSAGENSQVLSLTGERGASKLRGHYPRR